MSTHFVSANRLQRGAPSGGRRLPGEIQWAIPGNYRSETGFSKLGGNGSSFRVEVTEDAVPLLNADLARIEKLAGEGLCSRGFIDLMHEGGELFPNGQVAAWAKSFYWGGHRFLDGGIRLKVEWNEAIADKILTGIVAGHYAFFSPLLKLDGSRIIGLGPNVGGLCAASALNPWPIQLEI